MGKSKNSRKGCNSRSVSWTSPHARGYAATEDAKLHHSRRQENNIICSKGVDFIENAPLFTTEKKVRFRF